MNEASSPPPRRPTRYKPALLIVPGLLSAALVAVLWFRHPDPAYWETQMLAAKEWLGRHPWALVLTLAVLPGLGFPVSPVLILFGIVMAPRFGMPAACVLGIAAQSFCSLWTFLLASGPLRGFIRRHVLRGRELPNFRTANTIRIACILRITPGIPYAIQNVALGIIGIDLKSYLLVSIPIQSLYTVGFIVTGGAIFEGRTGLAITGALLLVAVVLLTRTLGRKRLKKNRPTR